MPTLVLDVERIVGALSKLTIVPLPSSTWRRMCRSVTVAVHFLSTLSSPILTMTQVSDGCQLCSPMLKEFLMH